MPYSYQIPKEKKEEKKYAKAYGKELNVSWRATNEVCYNIKGMNTKKALRFLQDIKDKKRFVHYRRFNKQIPHRKGGKPGRFPVKAAGIIMDVLKNGIANAEQKGLDSEKLKIEHITAYKAIELERRRPKGKMMAHNIVLTNIEIILKQV